METRNFVGIKQNAYMFFLIHEQHVFTSLTYLSYKLFSSSKIMAHGHSLLTAGIYDLKKK